MVGESSPSRSSNHREAQQESNGHESDGSSVQVAVRVRPMQPSEAGSTRCVEVSSSNSRDINMIRLGGRDGPKFTFDEVIPETAGQRVVYENTVAPLVKNCLEGYNATILAYGQTGSGKTHTMMGPSSALGNGVQNEHHAGVIPRAIHTMFRELEICKEGTANDENSPEQQRNGDGEETDGGESQGNGFHYEVRVQFLEVYGEDIRDLLTSHPSTQKLAIRDVGVDHEPEVIGATQQKVDSAEEALLCLTKGMFRRVTGSTAMNASSSRSHAILSLLIEQSTYLEDSNQTGDGTSDTKVGHVQAKRSKFHFVDLAGSERQKRTMAEGQRLKEGIDINKGLLVLGNVISALGDPKKQGKAFVPYRDSKLTRLLKGSLGGNHKTLMIACVSPSSNNTEETLNCLRYANRAKNIQNHAVVNIDATSHLITELRGKVKALASDLLKAREGDTSFSFPKEVLQSLANGGDASLVLEPKSLDDASLSPPRISLQRRELPRVDLQRTESLLRQTMADYSHSEEKLHEVIAEKEMYRLRLAAMSSGEPVSDSLQQAFTTRVAEYEREIAELKLKLIPNGTIRPQLSRSESERVSVRDDRLYMPQLPPRTPQKRIRNARHPERAESPELSRLRAQVFGSMSHAEQLDAEVEAEESALTQLTTKYGGNDEDNNENDDYHHQLNETDPQEKEAKNQTNDTDEGHQQLEADIFELSHSIVAKEELIKQLQVSQEKYEAMREFYEAKLYEMEKLLLLKEEESEKLSEDLKKLDHGHSSTQELAERLQKKQEHIAELKKKQRELLRLTSVASQNESQIAKLRNEVLEMKQKKVSLQKQITEERKSHAIAVQKLKNEAIQKDRELLKLKKESDRNAQEAQKAQQMAKTRLEQVGQLKEKYKEAEKQLRMQTVKNGVMQKAGLDPVMVGRRGPQKPAKGSQVSPSQSEKNGLDTEKIDRLRDFFDQKVADVGRREALAEKLAHEWEEHLELSTKRQELAESTSAEDSEALKSLDSQISSKEDRIRQLAGRLKKRQVGSSSDESSESEHFLFDKDFRTIVGGASPIASMKISAKVLFGMIVRERRRVAALARTASALDEKVQDAEAATRAKESAFRAYMDEHQHELTMLAQNQQEQILSLMDMVRDGATDGSEFADKQTQSPNCQEMSSGSLVDGDVNPKLLVLANERISVLERQLQEVRLSRESTHQSLKREEETMLSLREKEKVCDELQQELGDLRAALRQIRDAATSGNGKAGSSGAQSADSYLCQVITDIVTESLHSESKGKRRRSNFSNRSGVVNDIVPRIRHVDLMDTSDSEGVPDWAGDIMADLATIAEGKMPSSLRESPGVRDAEAQLQKNSVFYRLTHPNAQKQRKPKGSRPKNARSASAPPNYGQQERKIISRQIADSLDKVIVPEGKTPSHKRDGKKKSLKEKTPTREITTSGSKRSVFERLLSPSNLTGTQKQKFYDKKSMRNRVGGALLPERSLDSQNLPNENLQQGQVNSVHTGEDVSKKDNLLMGSKQTEDSVGEQRVVHGSRLDGYTQQDVFERLQKTTTQAYAVKQHGNIAEKMLHDLLDTDESQGHDNGKAEHFSSGFDRVDEYAQQNVFERLQKHTTHAYAGKQNANIAEKLLGNILEDGREGAHAGMPSPDHGSPFRTRNVGSPSDPSHKKRDVFMRLQRTRTEGQAKAKHALHACNPDGTSHEISAIHPGDSEVRALFSREVDVGEHS